MSSTSTRPRRGQDGVKQLLDRPPQERRLGPFLLTSPLGKGGFAPVWLAQEIYGATALRLAAVKLFSLESSDEAGGDRALRIIDEARALCRVEHPNVVRFYALAIDERLGVMGLAMEHVAGTSLGEQIAARGARGPAEAIEVGLAIASALAASHQAGVIHRDVKPANIIEAGGVYKLIDFGIAAAEERPGAGGAQAASQAPRVVDLDDLPVELAGTHSGTLEGLLVGRSGASVQLPSGTLGYMDPGSLARGEPATAASDLYALGVTLFECLVGKVPAATGAGGTALRSEILDGREAPPPVRSLAETPPSLAALIDALLAPERGERPASAEAALARLQRARSELVGARRALPPEEIGPFRGLGRFEEGDRDLYFGRSAEVAAALEVLRGRGLLSLLGPSGSGKSSLARAGVMPAIAEGALGGWPSLWDTFTVAPGRDPRGEIERALGVEGKTPGELMTRLAERVETTGRGVAVLVDQLEELTTLSEGASRDWTVELLSRLGEQPVPGLRVVTAARRDLLDALLALPGLGRSLVRGTVLIEPMGDLAWGEVLQQALAAYGYSFEDETLERELLSQLRISSGAMPLIQFALTELWKKRDGARRLITRQGLATIGGVAGALERHAEATVAPLLARGAEPALRAALLALTTARGTRATRTEAELREVGGEGAVAALPPLEEARLLVRSPAGVTLAHEALLDQWGRLRAWVAEARDDRLLIEELERDAERWEASPEAAPRWHPRRLAHAAALRERGDALISRRAEAYLAAGRRAERRGQLVVGSAVAAALLAILGGVAVYVRDTRSQQAQTKQALVREQSARAEADRRTQAIQQANDEIARLARNLDDAKKREELLAIYDRSQATATPAAPAAPARPGPLLPRASAAPVAPPPPTTKPVVKEQTEWK